jgi:hypothetical protein
MLSFNEFCYFQIDSQQHRHYYDNLVPFNLLSYHYNLFKYNSNL